MDIKQLRALLAVAETGSATKAADLLHIVQPAVSRHIQLLEEEFGVALFSRDRHGMTLTDAGKVVVEYGRRALRELDQAKAEIRPSSGMVSGTAAIGLLPSTADLLAAELVECLKQKHPQINVRITVGYGGHLQQWLEAGEVDVALLYDAKTPPALQVQPLLEEKLFLVGPPDAGLNLRKARKVVSLQSESFILPSAPHALRSLVEHAFAVTKISCTVVAETNSLSVQKSLVMKGFGYTVLPSCAVTEDVAAGLLSAAPITSPDLTRRIVLAHAITRRLPPAAAVATAELTALMKKLTTKGAWPGATWIAEK